eukprot:5231078-Ditylum_brightwellii.AAC.1
MKLLKKNIQQISNSVYPGGKDIPLIIKGRITKGANIVKALAVDATDVCIGKPVFFSLAVG